MIYEDHEYAVIWQEREAQRRARWSEEVRINPCASELLRLTHAAKCGGLRGMLHVGDLYWWQAYYATHNDARHWMKIAGSEIDIGVEMHVCEDGEVGLMAFSEETLVAAQNHHTLRGHFDHDGNLKPRLMQSIVL